MGALDPGPLAASKSHPVHPLGHDGSRPVFRGLLGPRKALGKLSQMIDHESYRAPIVGDQRAAPRRTTDHADHAAGTG